MGWQMATRWTYLPAFCGAAVMIIVDEELGEKRSSVVAWVWNHAAQILQGVKDEKQVLPFSR